MECNSYTGMLYSVAGQYDGDAQTLVHRHFFYSNHESPDEAQGTPSRDVMADVEGLREYLKGVWRVMVVYDVVIREAGGDPEWERECDQVLSGMFGVPWKSDS